MLQRAARRCVQAAGRGGAVGGLGGWRGWQGAAERLVSSSPVAFSDSHDDFKPQIKVDPADDDGIQQAIAEDIASHRVMLFMKGTRSQPMCGFSRQVVMVLDTLGVEYGTANVLESDALRDGIKRFSDWPTIPQLYVDKEFLGGCDIVTSMFQDGELEEILKEKGILN